MSFGWSMGIKTDSHVCWLLVIYEFNKRIGETKLRVGVFSFGSNTGIADEGIIGTKDECHSIQQKQFFFHASEGTLTMVLTMP